MNKQFDYLDQLEAEAIYILREVGWEPKKQRPELWNSYNGKINKGENVRVFPISNWTELDVWNYIRRKTFRCQKFISLTKETYLNTMDS